MADESLRKLLIYVTLLKYSRTGYIKKLTGQTKLTN